MTSEVDRNAVDAAQTESQVMNYLYFRYGTRLVVSGKMLDELENCKPPTSETLETFLVNLVVTCDFVLREKQATLVTPQRLNKIVVNNFDQSLSIDWAKRLLKVKDQSKNELSISNPSLNFEEEWQTKYGNKILEEFASWCKELVALHRTMKIPCKVSPPQASGRQSAQVKVASQIFKCILCGGSHTGKRGQTRKFMSVCNVFLEMSVPQRWNCVRRHKFCQVCIVQEDHGQFGQNCPLKTRLMCKCGSERLHHKLLCSSNTSLKIIKVRTIARTTRVQRGNPKGETRKPLLTLHSIKYLTRIVTV